MLIIHRCTACNHPDYWQSHTGKTAGDKVGGKPVTVADRRRTCCRRSSWGPPETAPRWSTVTGAEVTEVVPPGELEGGGSATCDCDACKALYLELTGVKPKGKRRLAAVPD